jgi:radical SAM protein with 4Fe4S-binding SPASM domain
VPAATDAPGPGEASYAARAEWSDAIRIERDGAGQLRYFRADDPAAEEYRYDKPFILELELTRRCNLRCIHCYASADNRSFAGELRTDEIRALIAQARAMGIRELSLTGGEVMLHPDLLPIMDQASALGLGVRFVTNATLAEPPLVAELARRPVRLVTVSLDAVSAAPHERIRGPGSHARAMAGIERMLDAGLRLSIITAFSRLNIEDFDALLDFCVARRIDWQVQMTSAKGRCPHPITLSPDEYYALGERVAQALARELPIGIVPMDDLATYSHFFPLKLLGETWKWQCAGGILNIFVRANGDVTPCSALCFEPCVVGNVRRDSLATICREERCRHALDWLRPESLTGECARCPFREMCRGGCPEILISMCQSRTENEYCYHRIEQARILREVLGDQPR